MSTRAHCQPSAAGDYLVYVSNAQSGTITRYRLEADTATLTFLGRTSAGDKVMPLAVSPDNKHLYAALRAEPWQVVTFKISSPAGDLIRVGEAPLPASMASIETDKTGRYLLAASYGDNLLSVSPVDQSGIITQSSQQTLAAGQHAHAVHTSADNRFAVSTALGDDQLAVFRFEENSGILTPAEPPVVATPAKSGPRHFVFADHRPLLYLLGELSGTVSTFRYDNVNGTLTLLHNLEGVTTHGTALTTRTGIPAGDEPPPVWAADIHLSPDGSYLYLSERNESVIITLKIDDDSGLPSFAGLTEVEKQPRGFALTNDGQFMVVAGEKSEMIGLYRINAQTGSLQKVDAAPTDKGANWVQIIPVANPFVADK